MGNEAIYSIGTIAPAMLADTGWVLEGASNPAVPVPAIPPVGVPGSAPLPVPLPSSGPTEVRPLVSAVSTRVTTSGGSLEVALSAMVASSSPNTTIVAVTYAVDGASPVPMTEVDGAFDAVAEAATAIITGLTGSHRICITATDSTGTVSEPECTTVSAVSAPVVGVSDPAGLPPASAPASVPLTGTLPRTGFPTAPAAALGAAAVAGGLRSSNGAVGRGP
ncbi:MAG: hypothetical protein M3471_05105 [Actinomycetota bacterium]|nr:hypothetical protein [Actinomycetota bacterium]